MTVYTTDFGEYTTGVNLSDWTDYWSVGGSTFYAQANSGDWKVGTKHCDFQQTADSRKVITWDDVGSVADSDIIVKINTNTLTSTTGVRILSRVGGTSGSEDCYFVDTSLTKFKISKYVSGSATDLISKDFYTESNKNYWMRFQTVGTTIRAKIWAENAIEPAEWKVSITDSSLSSGYCGFGDFFASVDFEVDYFSVGTVSDSAVFPPASWQAEKFGYVGGTDLSAALSTTTMAMGGLLSDTGLQLTGIRINHGGHTSDVRVAVYSGGDLTTGLNNATLLYDFGKSTSSTSPLELTCSPVNIPSGDPLWIALKSSGSGFTVSYASDDINSGNFQIARGRCDISGIIGYDSDVAFPSTFPNTSGTFASNWFDWNILLAEAATKVETPVISPVSGAYSATQSISMSCATSGASIYYTEDGSTPDSGDTLYSAPFTLGSAKTIKAIGIKAGLTDSDIATNIYTIAVIAVQPIITIMT